MRTPASLPRNVQVLWEVLGGGPMAVDECLHALAERGVVWDLARLYDVVARFAEFFTVEDGVVLRVDPISRRGGQLSLELEDAGRPIHTWDPPTPVSSVAVAVPAGEGVALRSIRGDGRPGLVLVHPDHRDVLPEGLPAVGDLALLAILVDPALPDTTLVTLGAHFLDTGTGSGDKQTPGGGTARWARGAVPDDPAAVVEAVARRLLAAVDDHVSWRLVGRLLHRAGDPLAGLMPDGPLSEEPLGGLRPVGDPLATPLPGGPSSAREAVERAFEVLATSGFADRPGQRRMAEAVADAFDHGTDLAVEAPTGTGKTFAYLIPADGAVTGTGRPVVVSTHTKMLQAQLRRDVARLRELGLFHVPFRQLQGVHNYVCARELAALWEAADANAAELRAAAVAVRVLATIPTGLWADVGDSYLRRDPAYREARRLLRTDAAGCERGACDFASRCPLVRDTVAARTEPGLVVVNHALFASWFADELEAGEDTKSLLQHQRPSVVFDEAHTVEEALTAAWTRETGGLLLRMVVARTTGRRGPIRALGRAAGRLRAHLRHLPHRLRAELGPRLEPPPELSGALDALGEALDALDGAALEFLREYGGEYGQVGLEPHTTQGRPEYAALRRTAADSAELLGRVAWGMITWVRGLEEVGGLLDETLDDRDRKALRRARDLVAQVTRRIGEHTGVLRAIGELPDRDLWVHRLRREEDPDDPTEVDWRFEQIPISIAGPFVQNVLPRLRSMVLTSATLTIGGDWEFLSDRLGIPIEDASAPDAPTLAELAAARREAELAPRRFLGLRVDSPFDMRAQARLVLTSHLPIPRSEDQFVDEVAEDIAGFVSLSRGRTLVLLAARKRLEAIADRLDAVAEQLADRGVTILAQGRGEPAELRTRFVSDLGTVLLGLRTYWEGFDAPGETLSFLVLEKPPYPPPDDPLVVARQREVAQRGKDPFLDYVVPMTAIAFAQGFGRLIRSEHDRGAVLVLDRRLQLPTAAAARILATLPEVEIVYARDRAEAWAAALEWVDGVVPDLSDALGVQVTGPDLTALQQLAAERPEEALHKAAVELFGISELRPGQLEAMLALLAGRDVLVVLPTGWGKSLCFQLPALLASHGDTAIVVSPLIALIKDQLDDLRGRRGLHQVQGLTSLTPYGERQAILRDLADGRIRMLYVSPERLTRDRALLTAIRQRRLTYTVVDEAHCVSVWGHDFRPEFRQIDAALRELVRSPRAALTATATAQVRDDIVSVLDLRDPATVVTPPDRPNLRFAVQKVRSDRDRTFALLRFVAAHEGRPGIVYVDRRARAEHLAYLLRAAGWTARHYHAGMVPEQREAVQDQFMQGMVRIVVATKAFGMGIDKPDIGWIVHFTLPESVEAYVQEAGRAARDPDIVGDCLLLWSEADVRRQERLAQRDDPAASAEAAWQVLTVLHRRGGGRGTVTFDPEELAEESWCEPEDLDVLIAWLERAGAVRRLPDATYRARITLGHRDPHHRPEIFRALRDRYGTHAQRLIVVPQVAEELGSTATELEDLLIGWMLDGLATFSATSRHGQVEVLDTTVSRADIGAVVHPWVELRAAQRHAIHQYADGHRCRRAAIRVHFDAPERTCGDGEVPCDVCARAPMPWEDVPASAVPDPDQLLDPSNVIISALAWIEQQRRRYGRGAFELMLRGEEYYPGKSEARPIPRGLLRCPHFGALRYLRGAQRRVRAAIDRLIAEGEIAQVEERRGDGGPYRALVLTDVGRRRARELGALR